MKKAFRILEIFWLVLGCVGIIMAAFSIATNDSSGVLFFLVFTLACGMMYAMRKRQRMKFTKQNLQENIADKPKEIKK